MAITDLNTLLSVIYRLANLRTYRFLMITFQSPVIVFVLA
jgi:hypothetical protein